MELSIDTTSGKCKWPNCQCTGFHVERSMFEAWPGICVVFLGKTLYCHSGSLNPLTPMSDQDRISPYNIDTISSRQVMRKKKNIN